MIDCASARELIPAAACALLEGERSAAVRRHLQGCAACQRELKGFQAAFGSLREPVEPPPDVWPQIEEAIAREVVGRAPGDDLVAPPGAAMPPPGPPPSPPGPRTESRPSGVWVGSPLAESGSGAGGWGGPGPGSLPPPPPVGRAPAPAAPAPGEGGLSPDDPIAYAMKVGLDAGGQEVVEFGPYDILGEVARGGMGIVYRARQRSLNRVVALKVMKQGENASPRQVRRFKRETQAAVKLSHPGIVAVHEVGCHEGFHFFTMDLIEGEPLDRLVKRKERLPVERAVRLVAEVAAGIHYAHEKGIVHRDLKPANVLLDRDGAPKVTDFGLAKDVDHRSMLTRTESVVGTPYYMPPEQARGQSDIDRRADVYALGVILYELLTLELPFKGETTMEVYHRILEEDPRPPRTHDDRVDLDLDTIVLKAIDKVPDRRYPTAAELAEDLRRYLAGEAIVARPLGPAGRLVKWARRRRSVVAVAAAACLVLSAGAGVLGWRLHEHRQAAAARAEEAGWREHVAESEAALADADVRLDAAAALLADRDVEAGLEEVAAAEAALAAERARVAALAVARRREDGAARGAERRTLAHRSALLRGRLLAARDPGDDPEAATDAALAALRGGLELAGLSPAETRALRLEVARVQAGAGRYAAARTTLGEVLDAGGKGAAPLALLGRVALAEGDPGEARALLGEALTFAPRDLELHLLEAEALLDLGRPRDARRSAEKALAVDDAAPAAWLAFGRAEAALGHPGEARDAYAEVIDLDPASPVGYHRRGALALRRGRVAEAIADLELALSRDAGYAAARLDLARALARAPEEERARAVFDEVLAADGPAWRAAAELGLARLDLRAADALLCRLEARRRARAGGDPAPLADELAEADRLARERAASAWEGFARAREAGADPPPGVPADALFGPGGATAVAAAARPLAGLARAALLLGRAEALAAGVERPPGDRAAALADLTEAVALLEAARARAGDDAPADPDPATEDGWEDPWADVVADPDDAAARDPAAALLARAECLRGQLTLAAGDLDAAGRAFAAAEAAAPRSGWAAAGRAHVALAAGRRDEAAGLFAEARARRAERSTAWLRRGRGAAEEARRTRKPTAYATARRALAAATLEDPLDADPSLAAAELAATWGHLDQALLLARRAAAADPLRVDAHARVGRLLCVDLPAARDPATGRPEHVRDVAAGLEAYGRAVAAARDPDAAARARFARARALLAADPDADARARAREDLRAVADGVDLDALAGQPPAAIRRARETFALLAELAEARGAPDEAARLRTRLAAVREQLDAAVAEAVAEGRARRDRLDYAAALRHFDRAIALAPTESAALYDRGTCYLKVGDFIPGILDFSRALELEPRIAEQVHAKVFQISYVVDLDRVITELNAIVADHPGKSYVVFLRGFFYVAKTEFEECAPADLERGIADFDECLALNPDHVTAYAYRALLWTKLAAREDDPRERKEAYARALQDLDAAEARDPGSRIAPFLAGALWAQRAGEPGLDEATRAERTTRAIERVRESLGRGYRAGERIENDPAFDAVRDDPRFQALLQGR